MRELVVDLYTEVFKFLCDALSWFMHRKTRIIGALSQRTKQDLNDKVVGIQKFVRRIKKEAKHLSQRDNKEKLDQILYLQTLTAGPDPLQHKLIGNETRQDNAEQNRQKRMNISERLGQRLGQCTLNTLHANEAAAGYQSLQMQPVEFVAVPIEDQDRRIEEIEDPSSSETGQDPNNEEQDPTDASSETGKGKKVGREDAKAHYKQISNIPGNDTMWSDAVARKRNSFMRIEKVPQICWRTMHACISPEKSFKNFNFGLKQKKVG